MVRLPAMGESLGPYRIVGLAGRGACGLVFKVEADGRTWALKAMHPALAATASGLARFKAEARALALAPVHPNLIRFKESFRDDRTGAWCLVTEWIEGTPLDRHTRLNGPLPPDLAAGWFMGAGIGLAAMHQSGFIHRDIRPANIMVCASEGRLVLLDFGLATHVDDRGAVILDGEVWHFPAPCQAQGFAGDYRDDARLLGECARFAMNNQADHGVPEQIRAFVETRFERGPWGKKAGESSGKISPTATGARLVPGQFPRIDLGEGVVMELAPIPAGDFVMGAPPGEVARDDDEVQRPVRLTRPFLMGRGPVTQAQWRRVMGNSPSWFRGDLLPVEQVSWDDSVSFCRQLSRLSGLSCRLPTEAEWEYACRAGTATAFHFGESCDGRQANCRGDLPYGGVPAGPNLMRTTPPGSYPGNPWGLFDMHGNVGEWCADWYGPPVPGPATDPVGPATGKHRIIRGGSWHFDPARCRAAYRNANIPAFRGNFNYGFRIAVDI